MGEQGENHSAIIVKITARAGLEPQARELAQKLNLQMVPWDAGGIVLRLDIDGLALCQQKTGKKPVIVRIDYVRGPFAYRLRHGSHLLCRAVRVKGINSRKLSVLDATAGLGRDAFLLANAGRQVRMIERHPVLAVLITDGLHRAALHGHSRPIVERISLEQGESMDIMTRFLTEDRLPDVVYLDPMFPGTKKSAKVGKEAAMLQALAASYNRKSDRKLLALALETARHRVVVKRPLRGPGLSDAAADIVLKGKTVRYDIYLSTCRKI